MQHLNGFSCVRFDLKILPLAISIFFLCTQGGTTQMRFQPRQGRYLAVAAENTICVLDVETQARRHLLQVGYHIWNLKYAMKYIKLLDYLFVT